MAEAQVHFFFQAHLRVHRVFEGLECVHVEVQSILGFRALGRLPLEPASGGALGSTMYVGDDIILVWPCAFANAKNQSALCIKVPLAFKARCVDRYLTSLRLGFFFQRHCKRCLNQRKEVARIQWQSRKSEKWH